MVAALAACSSADRKAPPPLRPNWLFSIPTFPSVTIVDTTGTADAQHVVIRVPQPFAAVTAFYRSKLPQAGWRITSDLADSIHATLYLERGGMPLWLQIDAQGPETLVAFTATAGGSNAPAPPARR